MTFLIIIILLLCIIHLYLYHMFPKPPKPQANTHYDYILVLGCPCEADGSLSSVQQQRIDAAVSYYQQGYAKRIIVSGGSVHNAYSEAEQMADALQKQLPNACIQKEMQARNTFQNLQLTKAAYPADRILVVSSPSHLRRAYLMVRKFYHNSAMGSGQAHDAWYFYLWEYTRLWNACYWEIRLSHKKK